MTLSDWSIKTFHTKAWHVMKTYKQLWLLGLAVLVFAGGSSMNFNNSISDFSDEDGDNQVEAQSMPIKDSDIDAMYRLDDELESQAELESMMAEEEVSEYSDQEDAAVRDFFMDVFTKMQPVGWLLAVFSFIAYIIIGVYIYVVGASWSQAALMLGVAEAVKDKAPDISKVSVRGLHYVKSVFLVGLLPWLAFIAGSIIFVILASIVGAIMQNAILGVILGIGGFIALLGGLILTNATIVLGSREAVLHSTGTRVAISRGFEMAKLYWGKTLALFFRNSVIEFLVTLSLFLPGIIAILVPAISAAQQTTGFEMNWAEYVPAIILFIAAAIAYFFFKSAYNVFTFTTWHLAHSVLRKATPSLQRA